jgi:hypothetical protein
LFTARDEPQKVDTRPPKVIDRASGAHDGGGPAPAASTATDHRSGPRFPDAASTADRTMPTVRVDETRIGAPAPRPHLSPAQALDLVRRSSERVDRDPGTPT